MSGAAAVRRGWQSLPEVDVLRPESFGATCDVGWEPVGARPDVNAATAPTVRQLLIAVGVGPATADSMSAALVDWVDPDTAARHVGAEDRWYRQAGRLPPANGPFMDLSQIRAVRGFESGAFDSLFSLEAGPVALNHAVPALLSTLPGFGDEAVAAVVRRRRSGLPVASIEELAQELSPPAATRLRSASSTLAGQISLDASGWVLRIASADSMLATQVFVEARLERRGATIGLSRYRTWVR